MSNQESDPVESTLPVGDTGRLLDTTLVTHKDGTEADREGVFVGDPTDAQARQAVVKDLDGDGYSAAVYSRRLDDISMTLTRIEQNQTELLTRLIDKLS